MLARTLLGAVLLASSTAAFASSHSEAPHSSRARTQAPVSSGLVVTVVRLGYLVTPAVTLVPTVQPPQVVPPTRK